MKEAILLQFGKKLRNIRTNKNMSQEELADKAGVHRTYIGMVERAEKNITLKNINKLVNCRDITFQTFKSNKNFMSDMQFSINNFNKHVQ